MKTHQQPAWSSTRDQVIPKKDKNKATAEETAMNIQEAKKE